MSNVSKKLRALRGKTGLSISQLALKLGYATPSGYQHYEDRFKKEYLPLELVMRLKKIFLQYGITEIEINDLMNPAEGRGCTEGEVQPTVTKMPDDVIPYDPELKRKIDDVVNNLLNNIDNIHYTDVFKFASELYEYAQQGVEVNEKFAEVHFNKYFKNK